MAVNIGSAIGYLDLDTTKFKAGFVGAAAQLNTFNAQSATMSTKLGAVANSMGMVGKSLTMGVTVPLAVVGAAAIKVGADFDKGMSEVKAISGATGAEFTALRDKAIELGAKTSFSATESAAAFKFMAQAGWKTGDMLNGIEGVMNLAAASGEDLAVTSDIVTDALTAFGLQASDSAMFADVLAQASSDTNTNVGLMGETFKYVAPIAGAMGYSIQDTAKAIGLMANNGIKGSNAGTALRSVLTNLANPTKDMKALMDEYGISLTDSEGNMKSLDTVMLDLRSAFSGMTEEQKVSNAATLAGKFGMSGLLAIVNASSESYDALGQSLDNSSGAAQKMADIMLDNLAGSFEQFKGALETLGIQLSDILAPKLRAIVDTLTGFIESISKMSDEQKNAIVNVALFAAALGPVLLILSKVIKVGLGVGKAFGFLSGLFSTTAGGAGALSGAMAALSGPLGWIALAIAGLVAGLTYLYKTNENVRDALNEAWTNIKNTVSGAIDNVKEPLGRLGEAFGNLFKKLEPLLPILIGGITIAFAMVAGAVNGAITALAPFIDAITNIVDYLSYFVDFVVAIFSGDLKGALEAADGMWQSSADFVENILKTITGFLDGFVEAVIETFSLVLDAMGLDGDKITKPWKEGFDGALEAVTEFITNTVDFFKELPDSIGRFLKNAVIFVAKFVMDVKTFFDELPKTIQEKFDNIKNNVKEFGENLVTQGANAVRDFIEKVKAFFEELPEKIKEKLDGAKENVLNFGNSLMEEGTESIQTFIESVKTFFDELPEKVGFVIGEMLGHVFLLGASLMEFATVTVPTFVETVITFFSTLPTRIQEWLTEAITSIITWGMELYNQAILIGTNFITNISTSMSNLGTSIQTFLTEAITNVINWGLEMYNKAVEVGTNFINNISMFISQLPSKISQFVSDAYAKVVSWGTQMSSKATETGTTFLSNISSFFMQLPGKLWEYISQLPAKVTAVGEDLKSAGKDIIDKLKEGITSAANGVVSFVQGIADSIGNIIGGIIKGFDSVVSGANSAKTAAAGVSPSGSFAIGKDYIPYNGFIAELHEGERVLTKQENREFSYGATTNNTGGDTFNFYNTQPTPYEYAKQIKKTKKELLAGF